LGGFRPSAEVEGFHHFILQRFSNACAPRQSHAT
jgi:hypothetical protein